MKTRKFQTVSSPSIADTLSARSASTVRSSATGSSSLQEEILSGSSKLEFRRYIRSLKKQFTHEETVLLYNSLPDEVYTHALIRQLHAEGKTVLLPVVVSETEMEIRHYTSPSSFKESSYGILEPVGEAFTDFPSITFALIPGMAFDAARHRLGRGKGYYDRFLPLLTNAYKLGICFPFQSLPSIPIDEYDQLVDEVIC